MIQNAMFSGVSAIEVSHNFRNPNPDHLHQDMIWYDAQYDAQFLWFISELHLKQGEVDNDPWKMLQGKQMFQVWPAGCSSKENCFFPWKGRGWLFSPSYWVNNVPGPHIYPHIDFAWIGSSPSMREKKSELEKLFFCKAPTSSHKTI